MKRHIVTPIRAVGLMALCGALSACALVPNYQRPDLDLPAANAQADTPAQADAQRQAMVGWWKRFDDPVLDELIHQALGHNLDIALQAARVEQARAQLGLAKTQFYPTLGGQAEAGRSKASVKANPNAAGHRRTDNYSVAATLGYELNIFSALAGHEAAQANLLSSAYAAEAMRLSIISDIVSNYMSLRSVQRKIRITKATIQTRADGLDLADNRYKYGAISKLELLQKRAILASARSQLPQLRQQASQLESALAILAGKTPREIMRHADIEPAPLTSVKLPGDLPKLLPSALVNRRPDVRAAEAALVATDAQVSVAKAQYFPTLNLTALVGSAATQVSDLFGHLAGTASASAAVNAPILTFGRIGAQVKTAESQRKQADIMYRQTVRQAFRDVRDALTGVKMTHDHVDSAREQVDAYKQTFKLAQDRYDVGRVGLQDVLNAQRQLYSAQLILSEAIRDRFVATANLFKALGGGWTEDTDGVPHDVDTGLPDVPHGKQDDGSDSAA